jgi:hypothetical protein
MGAAKIYRLMFETFKNIFKDRRRFQGLYIKTWTALHLKVNFNFGTGINIWYNFFFQFFISTNEGGMLPTPCRRPHKIW